MAFINEVVGGETLVRPAIRSANYIPGVSGWSINRDGTAEFASGTYRGPVVIVEPGTGLVLATIGANGDASFQRLTVNDDILLGDISLADYFATAGRGVVGEFATNSNLPNSGVDGGFAPICWTSFPYFPGRMYRVVATSTQWINTNASFSQDFISRLILNQPGITGGASNVIGLATRQSTSGGESEALHVNWKFGGTSLYSEGTMTVALQLAAVDGNPWTNLNPAGSTFRLSVIDEGVPRSSAGGTGAPAGQLQYTVRYPAIGTRAYREDGTFIGAPDGNNNIYQGEFADRAWAGNSMYQILFDGAKLRSDLSGGTLISARFVSYCTKCDEDYGNLYGGVSTYSALQGTLVDNSSGIYVSTDGWPVPGWGQYNMFNEGVSGGTRMIDRFLGGGNSLIGKQMPFGGGATGFYGYGAGVSTRPFIEVVYNGNPPSDSVPTGWGARWGAQWGN